MHRNSLINRNESFFANRSIYAHAYTGKARDLYRAGDEVLLVASDRVSICDVSLPTPIPDKGAILTQLSSWWFERLAHVTPHHVVSTKDVPISLTGRALRCKSLDMIRVECIVRGYLSGSAFREYQKYGTVWGVKLPSGLTDGSKLPEPIFTPTTKVSAGGNDEPISFRRLIGEQGAETAKRLRDLTLEIYLNGTECVKEQNLVIADTKVEFGWDSTGELTLGDEILTPDCTRFWPAEVQRPCAARHVYDKQVLRNWFHTTSWARNSYGPAIPDELVAAIRNCYIKAYERITGETWVRKDSYRVNRNGFALVQRVA